MPKNKSAAIRFRIIDQCINNRRHRYPSLELLAERCADLLQTDVSASTIEKDIRQMKMPRPNGYDAPIEYSKKNKGYFYAEQGFSITGLQLQDDEWNGLRYAAHLLHQYAEVPVFKDFKQAIEKINTRFNLMLELDEPDFDRYVQFETGNAHTGYEWIGDIIETLRRRWLLNIRYENIYKKEIRSYEVFPQLLKEHRNRWYLIAWVEERKDYLTFALDRIHELKVKQKVQPFRKDFNAQLFLRHSVGIIEADGKPQKLVLQIHHPHDQLIQLEPIHPSQKIIQKTDRHCRIELQVHINHELHQRILSMGPHCKVIQPAALKKQIRELLQKTLNHYGNE